MEFNGEMRKQGTFEVNKESSNNAVGILEKEETGQVKIRIFSFTWHRDGEPLSFYSAATGDITSLK